ncbi:hypothetical protein [uncultured Pseudoteredinibacter sp.]|uniref:hypothetical protein n=1 Tax=uncultured Pseudoteredinibacter sp. TaxID=1641701 RepID=UPI0026267C8D|nr:hypothetical protein [uncultured Pseudoteredinibacter sp.]
MKFGIEYKLEDHGWATVVLTDDAEKYKSPVSYLHDSLAELAQMAIDLKNGLPEAKVVFMNEPGELQLVVIVKDQIANYEGRWFNDWASWNMHPESEYKVVVHGSCSVARIIQQITSVLWDIHKNIGVEEYKDRWVEHEFPIKKFEVLANA